MKISHILFVDFLAPVGSLSSPRNPSPTFMSHVLSFLSAPSFLLPSLLRSLFLLSWAPF